MSRFVILRHEVPSDFSRGSHFDLMFEVGGQLLTWAVDELPTLGGPAVPATPLPPHRIAYLDYEGPLSNGRGTVRRIVRGTCAKSTDGDDWCEFEIEAAEFSGRMIFTAGAVRLEAMAPAAQGTRG